MKRLCWIVPLLCLGACSSVGSGSSAQPIIPDKMIRLTPSIGMPLGDVAAGAVAAVLIHFIYDPLAPNWEIKEEQLADDTFHLDLRMKRYHTGGGGEAMQVLKRRAMLLKRERGFGDYQLLEFTEGIDSKTLGAQRVAEGTIKLVQRQKPAAADSFLMNDR